MPESSELIDKLKASDSDIQQYVTALKAENAKLNKRIFKLEAENISLENRIEAIKEGNPLKQDTMSEEEIITSLISTLEGMGYMVTKK